jgi:hypothetical protein
MNVNYFDGIRIFYLAVNEQNLLSVLFNILLAITSIQNTSDNYCHCVLGIMLDQIPVLSGL